MTAAHATMGFEWRGGSAFFECSQCGKELVIKKPGVGRTAPATICILARAKKWVVSEIRKADCLCPDCHRAPKKPQDPESLLKTFKPKEILPMSVQPIRPDPQPTPDQRVQIRGLLDRHFDDSTGRYLDGMSDEKIATAINVPRIVVERIREVGYGPIKVDPEISSLAAAVARFEKELAEVKARLAKVMT